MKALAFHICGALYAVSFVATIISHGPEYSVNTYTILSAAITITVGIMWPFTLLKGIKDGDIT